MEHRRLLATITVNTASDLADADPQLSIAELKASPGSDGLVSLREAIRAANRTANVDSDNDQVVEPDRILFDIPESHPRHYYRDDNSESPGVANGSLSQITVTSESQIDDMDPDWNHTWFSIPLGSELAISEAVDINGYSQTGTQANTNSVDSGAGLNTVLRVEIDGSTADSASHGFHVAGGKGTVIRGLTINGIRSTKAGVYVAGGSETVVSGNFLGTDISGMVGRGGVSHGVHFHSAAAADGLVGGSTVAARNLLAGGGRSGVTLTSAVTGVQIQGNLIGTDRTGQHDLGVQYGIHTATAHNTLIGGVEANVRNIISGNSIGIYDQGSSNQNTLVQGNYIGTNVDGTLAVGNSHGIHSRGSAIQVGRVNGAGVAARNIISGNTVNGFFSYALFETEHQATVQGNYIGTDLNGTQAIANGVGVRLGDFQFGAINDLIGGPNDGEGNIISGNGRGIVIRHPTNRDNQIQRNGIGIAANGTALGNNQDGIYIHPGFHSDAGDPERNIVGGTTAGAGNVIAHNGGAGIKIDSDGRLSQQQPYSVVSILGNSIHSNGQLGIDLLQDSSSSTHTEGVSVNDDGDSDEGPNYLQNYPLLTSAIYDSEATQIKGTLDSTENTVFRVEFFANQQADASSFGEGRQYLGFHNVTTNGDGEAAFDVELPIRVDAGTVVTATATGPAGNTSEFSGERPAVADNQPPVSVPGGLYKFGEGQLVKLDGTASSDPDESDSLTFEWDLNYDGSSFDIDRTGPQPTFTFADEFAPRTIALRVTDPQGLSDVATTTLEVTNVAPRLTDAGQSLISVSISATTNRASLNGSFLDLGTADVHQVLIDWGDGSSPHIQTLAVGDRSFNATHQYAENTTTSDITSAVTVTVSDDDDGTDSRTVEVVVPGLIAGTIQGQKFEDRNGNGIRDGHETGINGWTIELIDAATGELVASQETFSEDLNGDDRFHSPTEYGRYRFEDVLVGSYLVREVPQFGWQQTSPTDGARLVSRENLSSTNEESNLASYRPALSGDGRLVVFESDATNLVADDTNGQRDIFVRDRETGELARVNVDVSGNQANGPSFDPSISSDGRFVSFSSAANNLVPGDTNQSMDIFVVDLSTRQIERVSVNDIGEQGNAPSQLSSLSADGRYVVFHSDASNLVVADQNHSSDVFVYDRESRIIELISHVASGNSSAGDSYAGPALPPVPANGHSTQAAISDDGRFVTFVSMASDLVKQDTNHVTDVFVYDRVSPRMLRASVGDRGQAANGASFGATVSGDGRYVAFASLATNLTAGEPAANGLWVFDRLSEKTTRIDIPGTSRGPQISGDGHWITFVNEVADSNSPPRIGLVNRLSHQLQWLTEDGNHHSQSPAITADGQRVAFESLASNLGNTPSDNNNQRDVFVTHASPAHQVDVVARQDYVGFDFANQKLLGTVTGTVYIETDTSRESIADFKSPLAGWTVYADANQNGDLDTGEYSTLSLADGSYDLELPAGEHIIRQVLKPDWSQTTPDEVRRRELAGYPPATIFGDDAIEGPIVIWSTRQEGDPAKSLFQSDGEEVTQLSDHGEYLQVAGGQVAWVHHKGEQRQLMLDGETIYATTNDVTDLHLDDGQVLWLEDAANGDTLMLYDGVNVQTIAEAQKISSPQLDNGNVAFVMKTGGDWRVMFYDGNELRQLSDASDFDPESEEIETEIWLEEATVAWRVRRDLGSEYAWNIYVGPPPFPLTNDNANNFIAGMDNGRIAWHRVLDGVQSLILDGQEVLTASVNNTSSAHLIDGHFAWNANGQLYFHDGKKLTVLADGSPKNERLADGMVAWKEGAAGLFLYRQNEIIQLSDGETEIVNTGAVSLDDGRVAYFTRDEAQSHVVVAEYVDGHRTTVTPGSVVGDRDFSNYSELPNLSISAEPDRDPVMVGQELTYTVLLGNQGNQSSVAELVATVDSAATLLEVADSDGHTSCSISGNQFACPSGILDPAEIAMYFVTVIAPAETGRLLLEATAVGGGSEANPVDNSVSLSVDVIPAAADVTLSAQPVAAARVGSPLRYTLTVANLGVLVAEETAVQYSLPSNVSFISAQIGQEDCDYSPQTGAVCRLGDVAPGEEHLIIIHVNPEQTGPIESDFLATSHTVDVNDFNNHASVPTEVHPNAVDLIVDIQAGADPAGVNQPLLMTAEITNAGFVTATDVVATIELPATVKYNGVPSGHDCTLNGNTLSCDLPNISAGGTTSVEVQVIPNLAAPLTHQVSVSGSKPELNVEDNSASVFSVAGEVGLVRGLVFDDLNRDGVPDDDDRGLVGRLVYADLNRNRRPDPNEPQATTDSEGHYELHLPAGEHVIREAWRPDSTTTLPGIVIEQRTDDLSQDDVLPQIYDGQIAWQSETQGLPQVWLYDGQSNVLLGTSAEESGHQIDRGQVVWVYPDAVNDNDEIRWFNGDEVVTIEHSLFHDADPDIFDGHIVWGGRARIAPFEEHVFSFENGQLQRLSELDVEARAPQIGSNLIAWKEKNGNADYIGTLGGESLGGARSLPQVSDGQAVWTKTKFKAPSLAVGVDIRLYDGTETFNLTDDEISYCLFNCTDKKMKVDDQPQIDGGEVVWKRKGEITHYDIATEVSTTLAEGDKPQISRGNVVWQDWDDNHGLEIFLWDGVRIVQLTHNNFTDKNPQIHAGQITWSGYDGNDYEIFHAVTVHEHLVSVVSGNTTTDVDFGSYVDIDQDGVDNGIEDKAPNDGDGNYDGIQDSEQAEVASLPAVTGAFVTLASPAGTNLVDVRVTENPSAGEDPISFEAPIGFVHFNVEQVPPDERIEVDLIVPTGQVISTYYKFGVEPEDDPQTSRDETRHNHFYEFLFDPASKTGAELLDLNGDGTLDVRLHLVDGGRGDNDLEVNGIIVDPGAPTVDRIPWQNPLEPLDVSGDGTVSPGDVLLVINELNSKGSRSLAAPDQTIKPPPYLDVNGDNALSPADGLIIINALNQNISAEGESVVRPSLPADPYIWRASRQPESPKRPLIHNDPPQRLPSRAWSVPPVSNRHHAEHLPSTLSDHTLIDAFFAESDSLDELLRRWNSHAEGSGRGALLVAQADGWGYVLPPLRGSRR